MRGGRYSGEVVGDPAGVPCDPEQWSEESKRSVAYEFRPPRPYQDKEYVCGRCQAPDVFTAIEQKYTFEVQKAPIEQSRVLCRACHGEWVELEQKVGECRRRWAAERATLRNDPEFLYGWLVGLEALPKYNRAEDEANIAMLRRRIAKIKSRAEPDGRTNAG